MASLKIRVKLNEGRIGIPLDKLASISKEMKSFLVMLSSDVGFDDDEWLAGNFENGCVLYDCARNSLDKDAQKNGRIALKSVFTNNYDNQIGELIRPATRLQFSKIATAIDSDEVVKFAIYQDDSTLDEWHILTKSAAGEIEDAYSGSVYSHGEIQGIVHAFYKEARKPRLVVRELSTRALIDCYFKPDMYQSVVETMTEPDTVIFVEGRVTEDIGSGLVKAVDATDFRPAPSFDQSFFDSFLGSHPKLTGDKST